MTRFDDLVIQQAKAELFKDCGTFDMPLENTKRVDAKRRSLWDMVESLYGNQIDSHTAWWALVAEADWNLNEFKRMTDGWTIDDVKLKLMQLVMEGKLLKGYTKG